MCGGEGSGAADEEKHCKRGRETKNRDGNVKDKMAMHKARQ